MEENLDTLLDRVTAKVAGEAQKVEKKHGQRMVAENMIYEQRLERVEAKLRALEGERKNLTDTDLALKTSRANLTKVFRATQAKMDVASGEVAEMETVSMKEARLINDELKAKLRALDNQKSKAEMILAEEGGVVTSVRGLILNLVKLNETRAIAEAKKRIAAVKKAVLERTNGVNMTALAKEGDELATFGADIIAEEKRHENLTKTRESLHHNAKFETAVQDLIMAGDEIEQEGEKVLEAQRPNKTVFAKKVVVVMGADGKNRTENSTEGSDVTTTARLDEMLTTVNDTMAPIPKTDPDTINLITGMPTGFTGAPKPQDDGGSDAVFGDVAKLMSGGLHVSAGVVETNRMTDGLFVTPPKAEFPRNINLMNGLPNIVQPTTTPPPAPSSAASGAGSSSSPPAPLLTFPEPDTKSSKDGATVVSTPKLR